MIRHAGHNYGFPQVDMDVYNLIKKGEQPQVCVAVKEGFATNPCVVLKTHAAYTAARQLHSIPGIELENVAYVHIYRNPLDVLLSYLNYSRLEYKFRRNDANYRTLLFREMLGYAQPYEYDAWQNMTLDSIPQANLDHALDHFSDRAMTVKTLSGLSGSWIENTQSWFDAAAELPGVSLRYEDCLIDPEQFVKLCDLFTFSRSDVLKALDVVNLRAKTMSKSGNPDQAVFYSRMSAFYFTEYFSKGAIERFLNRHEGTLERFGYAALLTRM